MPQRMRRKVLLDALRGCLEYLDEGSVAEPAFLILEQQALTSDHRHGKSVVPEFSDQRQKLVLDVNISVGLFCLRSVGDPSGDDILGLRDVDVPVLNIVDGEGQGFPDPHPGQGQEHGEVLPFLFFDVVDHDLQFVRFKVFDWLDLLNFLIGLELFDKADVLNDVIPVCPAEHGLQIGQIDVLIIDRIVCPVEAGIDMLRCQLVGLHRWPQDAQESVYSAFPCPGGRMFHLRGFGPQKALCEFLEGRVIILTAFYPLPDLILEDGSGLFPGAGGILIQDHRHCLLVSGERITVFLKKPHFPALLNLCVHHIPPSCGMM